MKKIGLLCGVTLMILSSFFSTAIFANPKENTEQTEVVERDEAIRTIFIEQTKILGRIDQFEGDLKSKELSSVEANSLKTNINLAKEEYANLEKELEELGIIKLNDEENNNNYGLQSLNGDFTHDNPGVFIYYDNQRNKYLAQYSGGWINDAWKDDAESSCPPICGATTNVGGTNGVGIFSMNADIRVDHDYNFYTFDTNLNEINRSGNNMGEHFDTRGFAVEWQDVATNERLGNGSRIWYEYDSYRVLLWFYFDFVDNQSGNTLQFKAEVAHTWSSAYVSSISFGPWSFGIGLSNGVHGWTKGWVGNIQF